MNSLPPLFASSGQMEQQFSDGLAAMLEQHQGLGVYILVLANAAYDKALWTQLSAPLAARHSALSAAMTRMLRHNQNLHEPDDDVMVFLKLQVIGFEHLQTGQSRNAGPWQLSFNPIRALRPPRISGQKFDRLSRPFDPTGFHFNKAFLAKENLWQGTLVDKPVRLLYNKFPFARLHGLLLPEPERQLAQMLTPELHDWAWDVCARTPISGLNLAYNSTGAGASVNHLHFQSFVQPAQLPVQNPLFAHNGGNLAYPLPCLRFDNPQQAWAKLDQLHQHNQPYNLLYSKHALHLVPRVPQGDKRLSARSNGYGWSEMAGAINLFGREEFESMDTTEIETELASFAA
jgi:hypothetical protein